MYTAEGNELTLNYIGVKRSERQWVEENKKNRDNKDTEANEGEEKCVT